MTETLNRAMRLLAQRDHSETELRRKLAAQDVSEEDVEQAIAYCHEHHWLDDRRFAERYLVMRSQKGYGVQRIQQELGMKGIARDLIHDAFASSDIDWCALAKQTAHRKFGQTLPQEWKEKAKVQRFLLYRGFFQEEIYAVFSNLSD
ncbi:MULTISPECIES: recombination regulator RecX [Hafnia]|uniref:Regulatory protein RecX n=2 Tax=Hafnia TaxID=568 RepID=A0A4Q9F051_9GAMM|nr:MULTISPECIES: recombination regulator RecX [Hafnia]AJR02234.1 Regulatory protein RecX [Enterobacteriaceae bacterium bta3-1]QQE42058.1 recombination regulator RecX [Hafnia alvei]TBM32969.1 recombination regulator RecX [Hafnia paralvei]